MDQLLVTVNIFSTFFMCGLIWFIQLVHYPSFMFVDRNRYTEFQRFHMVRITWIVLPVMSIELISSALLWSQQQGAIWTINLFLLLLIWCSTLAIQTPNHAKLEKGFDQKLVMRLIGGNWIRTTLWSARAIILVLYLIQPAVSGP